MRILLTADDLGPVGGVELSTLQVGRGLAERGHRCELLYVREGSLSSQWRDVADTMVRVPGFTVATRAPWRTLHHLPRAVSAARSTPADVVYLNRAEQLPFAALAARTSRPSRPLVVHLRHHPFPARLVRVLRRSAHSYLAVSAAIRDEWVAAGLEADRVRVVHNGVDPAAYPPATAEQRAAARAALGIRPDAEVALHYGRLTADKGVGELLRAWRRSPSAPGRMLMLAGTPDADIAAQLADAAGPDLLVLPTRPDVVPLLHAADLAVVPSRWAEPFGRVVIEAMSAGVPVIAAAVGGIPEILTDRFADGLVPAGDVGALARWLQAPASWRQDTPDLGVAARDHVIRHFSLEGTVDGVESALQAAMGSAARSSPGSSMTPASPAADESSVALAGSGRPVARHRTGAR